MLDIEKQAYQLLDELDISYHRVDHPAITSVKNVPFDLPGPQVKNLVLKAKKGKRIYLVILPDEKQADLKKLAEVLDEKRLSFLSEETLFELLGVHGGVVTPLALPNDTDKQITVVLDQTIDKEDTIGVHPNINTTTLMIQFHDFEKILEHLGYEPLFILI
ncbi:prolyl-tRNA synthetase associated domain-containing protein [Vagococcus hydrophili]|uniref:Prolyl-tRNA synthetase associated domain-containing protein n=1 Tax=Vagococcus hydrophili TaxID=2714947 RepID=A0A6G8ASF1_9ENTE|nr:YbaK/EbsC family protein [Vagococcus hydrophili]QIL47994.1 prolyl-tRNA synthetase associated domain-containing protein [Vagococcus hydrophili]